MLLCCISINKHNNYWLKETRCGRRDTGSGRASRSDGERRGVCCLSPLLWASDLAHAHLRRGHSILLHRLSNPRPHPAWFIGTPHWLGAASMLHSVASHNMNPMFISLYICWSLFSDIIFSLPSYHHVSYLFSLYVFTCLRLGIGTMSSLELVSLTHHFLPRGISQLRFRHRRFCTRFSICLLENFILFILFSVPERGLCLR